MGSTGCSPGCDSFLVEFWCESDDVTSEESEDTSTVVDTGIDIVSCAMVNTVEGCTGCWTGVIESK